MNCYAGKGQRGACQKAHNSCTAKYTKSKPNRFVKERESTLWNKYPKTSAGLQRCKGH